ncbi:FIG001592: Phosphocarrier protein kinase/phosphorylase, nitrogen regulation associated [hydrothermal vent metagenome]|uniref:phosphoenolpyruvate--protein phosphotransferase n=1 Tax=hydrothermal vent metagenome TaxID=652676 RepID=A0A3B1AS04_9ZZZZ
MLNTLRRIIQAVSDARDLDQALDFIVQQVREAMKADVCSVYLSDNTLQQHVLMASEGLAPESIGNVRIGFGYGLVSIVASRAEPLSLDNAPNHPAYHYFPETAEEQFFGFLGVPILHQRKVLGVLVVQQVRAERFDEEQENFLITIAAQLANAMAYARASGEIEKLLGQHEVTDSRPLIGLPGAPGVAIGTAVAIYPSTELEKIPDRVVDDLDQEIDAFHQALNSVKNDISKLSNRLKDVLPDEERALFDAYLLMLDSHSLRGVTAARIMEGNWAPGALRYTIDKQVQKFAELDDPYMRERAEDLRELARRILHYLVQDAQREIEYPQDTILVGDELTAAQLAEVPRERLAGVISATGSRTSHVAILARALDIPAVMGSVSIPLGRIDGLTLIADGYSGNVFISPSKQIKVEYERLAKEEQSLDAELLNLRNDVSVTSDGQEIPLTVNTGLLSDISPSLNSGADGIGLYRTEFPFMTRQRFPGEEEQLRIYRQALKAFAPKSVTLRTLDVGGDKALPYFPIIEDNPFLGWRGIRITLDHPELFLVQVRAMMRAAIDLDNLQILLPMISQMNEIHESLALIRRSYDELKEEGFKVTMPKVGVMIEVPSAVYQAQRIAELVDFLSIGTNDLTQYLLAVDRNNAQVASLYDALHPAVIMAVQQTVIAAHAANKPASVCGEMAGDPAAAVLLVGMGIDSLSMSASSLNRVKWVIRSLSSKRARQYLDEALDMEDAVSIREFLNSKLENAGMGGLVRAGR